jgi:hypothetical protein
MSIYANNQAIHQIQELQARQQLVLQEMHRQKAAEAMGPSIVNGSMNGSPMVEANGLTRVPSEGQASFSSLPEQWGHYDASNGHHSDRSDDISPTRTIPHQWGAPAFTNGLSNGLPPIETSNVQRAHPQEIKSATIPLLSPVFETRTPSPTANRSQDLSKLVNGNGTNGHKSQPRSNNQQHRRASLTGGSHNGNGKDNRTGQQKSNTQSNDRPNKSNAGGTSPSSWQQPPARKKGKKSKPRAQDQKTMGEPLPTNAADRKGG